MPLNLTKPYDQIIIMKAHIPVVMYATILNQA